MVVSDNDAGGKGQEQEPKRAARPVTAAARRERRASARPAGKAAKDGDRARPSGKASAASPVPDGKAKAGEVKKGRATPKRTRKDKKPSLFARLVRFIREVWAELRKVIWPTRKQMVTYTTVVLVFVAFMVALVSLLDFAFRKGVFWLFG
ncbi:preprotein translocase subunit SecE [Amycolatopsis methanolica]|uniref:preprotein translocase subunit SecE n=1 Tax=Amycolatopsis methanolica TaxID=1814 RepID=UPI000378DAAD|nr:preprotein translocase subunit SecE [Amycolatopsis methanolica]